MQNAQPRCLFYIRGYKDRIFSILLNFNQLYDDYGIDKIVVTDTIGIMLPYNKKFASKIINNCIQI